MTLITETIYREFQVELTEGELAAYGQQSARLTLSLVAVVEEHAAQKKDFAAKEKGIVNEINRLSHSLAEGKEYRDVECRIVRDHDRAIVTITRCDTGEVLEERPFTNAEMTLPLPPDEDETVASMDAQHEGAAGEEGETAEEQAEELRQAEPDPEADTRSAEDRFNALVGASGDGAEFSADDANPAPPDEASAAAQEPDSETQADPETDTPGEEPPTTNRPKRAYRSKDRGDDTDAGATPPA